MCVSAGHGDKTGTNLYGALNHVSERLGVLKIQSPRFNETQNVIVIETDGKDKNFICAFFFTAHSSAVDHSVFFQVTPTSATSLR